MNIREATISKLQQLPEPLLQEVDDFIDFVLLKHNAGSQVSSNSKQKFNSIAGDCKRRIGYSRRP
jgi:Protein of unknown function (DUF2281)